MKGALVMKPDSHPEITDALLQRVCGEFLEMPGMRLTPQQAKRLWGLDEQTCLTLLQILVDEKFLARSREGGYGRCSDGPVTFPRPRMAKAGLDIAVRPGKTAISS
jgi:hypothetical protein